jgi:MFS family permease
LTDERVADPLPSQPEPEPPEHLDPRRVRSFVGLVLARLGPRAHGAVAGIFLALLVGEHTGSLFLVTFALTAHRMVTWIVFPLAGRWSDRSQTSLGRRIPYMAGGLLVAGACTAVYTRASNYWMLVALLVVTRVALVAYEIPAAAVTPEAFGNSRWLRAGLAVTVGGLVVGLSIRLTAVATWDQSDPSTWTAAYYLSAGYIIFAGLAILLLVREAPDAARLARQRTSADIWETVRSVLAMPNAPVLLAALLLATAAGGAFDRVYPVYARDMLGAGGDTLAAAGILSVVLGISTIPFAWWFAGRMSRRRTALWAGIASVISAIAHLYATELWHSVVLLAASGAFFIATAIALTPLYLQILPRRGGLGERLGVIIAPFLLAGMVAGFFTGLLFDVLVHDYRAVWIPTAVLGLAGGLVIMFGLRGPEGRAVAHPGRMFVTLRKLLWGRRSEQRQLFRGELTEHEVDGTALLELVADELNPYTQRD